MSDTTPQIEVEQFARAHAEDVILIDVREPSEYAEGHVPGARLVPTGELPVRQRQHHGLAVSGRPLVTGTAPPAEPRPSRPVASTILWERL